MRKSTLSQLAAALLLLALLGSLHAPGARAAFGFAGLSAAVTSGDGSLQRGAGSPADVNTRIELNTKDNGSGGVMVEDNLRDVKVDLPPGFVGNPNVAATCTFAQLFEGGAIFRCPVASQVGIAQITGFGGGPLPIYNMTPPSDAPALFAFNLSGTAVTIEPRVRPEDYGISVDSVAISTTVTPIVADITFWGVPADPIHNALRYDPETGFGAPSPSQPERFLTSPTSCPGTAVTFTASIDSWQDPGVYLTRSLSADRDGTPFTFTGCESLPFAPAAEVTPASRAAAAPTGLDVELTVPQSSAPDGLASAHVRKTVVRFPEGVTVNPPSATGQGTCTEAEIGLATNAAPTCPDSARIGTVEITTPLLDETLSGSLYLAEPHRNPFGSLLATYLAVKGPGFYLKLPGKVTADPATGRLTATFDEQPQLPYETVSVSLREGPGAPLILPADCGTYATEIEMTSWASPVPVTLSSPMTIDQGCDTGGFAPDLHAGTTNPTAGAYSPFVLRLTRRDGEQNLARIAATLPEGLLARLAGVPLCPDAAATTGDCPPASQIGTTTVAIGAGPTPLFVPEAGKAPTAVYLAGPYKGAPYSLVVKVPAQAGPFDLGTVAVRSSVEIDPVTAQVSVASDSLPQILEGIPLAYRDLRVQVDRPDFTLNPTGCAPKRIAATITSAAGAVAHPSPRFGLAGCGDLGFKPKLRLTLKGPVHRRAHPSLRAHLSARPGDANIARAQVKLPKSAFLDNDHIDGICSRVQFAAAHCPADSIYGNAAATTPLLDYALAGPVYLRANPAHELPDLVAALRGPGGVPIEVELAGRTDSVNGALRNTFEAVPDVPVTRFHLELFGGKRGLIEISSGFCASPRAKFRFTGQNGKRYDGRPKVSASCPETGKNRKRHRVRH